MKQIAWLTILVRVERKAPKEKGLQSVGVSHLGTCLKVQSGLAQKGFVRR